MTRDCLQALAFFLPGLEVAALVPLGSGRINNTWLATTNCGEKFVLQRLNPAVFPRPSLIQDNLIRVTEHFRSWMPATADSSFRTFQVLRSPAGEANWIAPDGAWWRLLSYVDGIVVSTVGTAQARAIGVALGLFHRMLSSLPPPPLADPLPGFHDTPLYLARYQAQRAETSLPEASDCRDFVLSRRNVAHLLEHARQQAGIAEQTIHGDPKVGNFLFSHDGTKAVSLVDFDTVKPGLLLHDIGDCLRSCCNTQDEEANEPDKAEFDPKLFCAVLAGYLSQAAGLLGSGDFRLIVDSARVIALELGLRFYVDYLSGSRYFKADHPEQNLFRARVQFALVRSIESQYSELTAWVRAAAEQYHAVP